MAVAQSSKMSSIQVWGLEFWYLAAVWKPDRRLPPGTPWVQRQRWGRGVLGPVDQLDVHCISDSVSKEDPDVIEDPDVGLWPLHAQAHMCMCVNIIHIYTCIVTSTSYNKSKCKILNVTFCVWYELYCLSRSTPVFQLGFLYKSW